MKQVLRNDVTLVEAKSVVVVEIDQTLEIRMKSDHHLSLSATNHYQNEIHRLLISPIKTAPGVKAHKSLTLCIEKSNLTLTAFE